MKKQAFIGIAVTYSNDFVVRMARDSLRIFQHFAEIVGGDCGFVTTGMIVAANEKDGEGLRSNVQMQQAQGVKTRMIAPMIPISDWF